MKEQYLLNIKAEDSRGLLHRITGLIERNQTEIISLNFAPTDIHDVILITVEVMISERQLASLALKIEKIIEVYAVSITKHAVAICVRAAYFKLHKLFFESPQVRVLEKHQATIVTWNEDYFLVAKYGSDLSIQTLYNEIEGPHLLSFSQTGLIADTALETDIEVRVNNQFVNPAEELSNRLAA